MKTNSALLMTALLVLATLTGVTQLPTVVADDAAGGNDAADNDNPATTIPLENYWYGGDVDDSDDQYDYYTIDIDAGATVQIEVVGPQTNSIDFAYRLNGTAYNPIHVIQYGNTYTFAADNANTASEEPLFLMFRNDHSPVEYEYCFKVNHINNMTSAQNANPCVIVPTITVVDPNGGDIFPGWGVLQVNWTWTGPLDVVNISITHDSPDENGSWVVVAEGIDNDGEHNITLPVVETNQFLVKISSGTDGRVYDSSDDYSTITVSPDLDISNCSQFNGEVGPGWSSGTLYMYQEIVEYPVGSGDYWMSKFDYNSDTPQIESWFGPCRCEDIFDGEYWVSQQHNNQWEVVSHNGNIWISQINENTYEPVVGDPYGVGIDPWILCDNGSSSGGDCDYELAYQYGGFGGPVWNNGDSTTTGNIYEYPANSGEFWIAIQGLSTAPAPDSPGGPEVWEGWCNCSEIWDAGGEIKWDSSLNYNQWVIVEHPPQSGTLWIAVHSTTAPEEPGLSSVWRSCGDSNPSGGEPGPCGEYTTNGPWPMWENPLWTGIPYSTGDQVSYGNGLYISITNGNTVEPNDVGRMWMKCDCEDLPSSLWSSSTTYLEGDLVSDSNDDYWIALLDHYGVEPTPFETHDPNGVEAIWWRPCDYCKLSDSHIDGKWQVSTAGIQGYEFGDIVSYQGNYYISIVDDNRGEPNSNIMHIWILWNTWIKLTIEQKVMGWVECNCSQIANGEVFQQGQIYSAGDVRIGPDGEVWISKYNNNIKWPGWVISFPMITPSGHTITFRWVIPTWEHCEPRGGCGEDPVTWNQVVASAGGYFANDVVEHPAGSGHEWRLLPSYSGTSVPPGVSMIATPGPWKHCLLDYDWTHGRLKPGGDDTQVDNTAYRMRVATGEEVADLPVLNQEDGEYLVTLDETGFPDMDHPTNDETSSGFAIRANKPIAELSDDTLRTAVEYGIWIVEPCSIVDSSFLTGNSTLAYPRMAGELHCGMWFSTDATLEIGDEEFSILIIEPGNLCSGGFEGLNGTQCADIMIELVTEDGDIDRTPRISLWPGKVNQHNEDGRWMTDPDGVSGGGTGANDYGGRELEYCQKFWPETVSVELRDDRETITFYTSGNQDAYESTKDVWECVQPGSSGGETSDADGDGVIDEWDECPDTDSSLPTDSTGCSPSIDEGAAAEGGALPAMGIIGVISALSMAVLLTRRRFKD